MKKGHLTLSPEGGLANRMRAIVSAYNLCKAANSKLQVIWHIDKGLNAKFKDLFEPIETSLFSIREATFIDSIVNSRPRRHNFWLPLIVQFFIYQGKIQSTNIPRLRENRFDFFKWQQHRCNFMSSYDWFGSFSPTLYKQLFHPCAEVLEKVEERTRLFSAYTIGMHIRRTDNVVSISKSPTHLFIEAGQKELEAHSDLKIFLATDSDDVKRELRNVFGDRLITTADTASRNSTDGIVGGLVDMYTLSHVKRIYGSVGSTFSKMAADIGDCPLVYMEKKDE